MTARVVSAMSLLAVCAVGAPARAYRTFADDPAVGEAAAHMARPIAWDVAFMNVEARDLVQIEADARAAVAAWSVPECADISAAFMGTRSGRAELGDGLSTIEIVGSGWGDRGFDENRGAITEVRLVETADGWHIAEADVYVDFETHRWSVSSSGPDALDLRAVLTHEWGHVLGFDHPHAADADAESSTMFPTYVGQEQRMLSADDVAGACALYPRAVVPCDPACAVGERCVEGVCIADCSGPEPGPGCCMGRDCDTMCAADLDCASPAVCGVAGRDRGWCQPPRTFGAPCNDGAGCTSGLCAVSMQNGAFCTQACATGSDCPEGTTCQMVDGASVCAPVLSSASCTAGPPCGRRPGSQSTSTAVCVALVLVGAFALRGRRRRAAVTFTFRTGTHA